MPCGSILDKLALWFYVSAASLEAMRVLMISRCSVPYADYARSRDNVAATMHRVWRCSIHPYAAYLCPCVLPSFVTSQIYRFEMADPYSFTKDALWLLETLLYIKYPATSSAPSYYLYPSVSKVAPFPSAQAQYLQRRSRNCRCRTRRYGRIHIHRALCLPKRPLWC